VPSFFARPVTECAGLPNLPNAAPIIDAHPEQVEACRGGANQQRGHANRALLGWLIQERSTIGRTPSTMGWRMLTHMHINFQRTELVNASPQRMFAVLTDYARYPRINHYVTGVKVPHHDAHGASVVADRRTPIDRHVRFVDTYASSLLLQLERRYSSNSTAVSTWTVEPAHGGRSYFTIAARMTVPALPGVVLRPQLWRMLNQINFAPFITVAEAGDGRVAMQRTIS
jgi:Polyketide cyclase / dehydrase and lipid transport